MRFEGGAWRRAFVLLVVAVEEFLKNVQGVDSCECHHVGIEMGGSAPLQSFYEFVVLVPPAVDGLPRHTDGCGDFGVGFPEDVGDGEHLLFLEHFFAASRLS